MASTSVALDSSFDSNDESRETSDGGDKLKVVRDEATDTIPSSNGDAYHSNTDSESYEVRKYFCNVYAYNAFNHYLVRFLDGDTLRLNRDELCFLFMSPSI